MTIREMIALLGAHTLGFVRCTTLRDSNNANFVIRATLGCTCPNNNNTNKVQLDSTPGDFDKVYFDKLNGGQGLLLSDNVLMGNSTTAAIVRSYSDNVTLFFRDFSDAMIKLGNLPPRAGVPLEVRNFCGIRTREAQKLICLLNQSNL